MNLQTLIDAVLAACARETDDRHAAIMDALTSQKDLIMALSAATQALHDAVAAQGVAITDATAELGTLETKVADLTAQLAALPAGAPIDPDDLAEIVASTEAINASIASTRAAMPVPVPAPVVDAAAAAA